MNWARTPRTGRLWDTGSGRFSSPWYKYGSYQGMPSGMPSVLRVRAPLGAEAGDWSYTTVG
ncbi:hypothetical protein SBA7_1350003 [Candidatus Sulfotelmatobacter sp. SbA7]|nr:hypothetical protein SBA7_1350003 [Candidatus Sulfotelmatobacter sp. SbA7]